MRRRSLLLCFIHGFKGTDDTFDGFPGDLRALVSNAFPNLNVKTVVYPQYETRGDLPSCVANFREWLQNRVFDLEVAAGNPSPIFEPSVRTILVAHSMGGIVAADTLLSILDDDIITLPNGRKQRKGVGFMFPHIQGILAFDTPYLGLSPAMFAYGTDTKLRSASTTISQISGFASTLLASRAATEGANVVQKNKEADAAKRSSDSSSKRRSSRSSSHSRSRSHSHSHREPPAPPPAAAVPAAGLWGGWGKVAAYAGAASLLAAGGAIAYFKREELGHGIGWVSSHLEFVGALMKSEELQKRTKRASSVPGVGFATLYTALGEQGKEKAERTFVILPAKGTEHAGMFYRCVNPKASDEVDAHVSMFSPKTNPWYPEMGHLSRDLIAEWADRKSVV